MVLGIFTAVIVWIFARDYERLYLEIKICYVRAYILQQFVSWNIRRNALRKCFNIR
jgi:hypothetical protein